MVRWQSVADWSPSPYIGMDKFFSCCATVAACCLSPAKDEAEAWIKLVQVLSPLFPVAASGCDTGSWTALDEITFPHDYSFKSIAAWPVDGCLVCKPTERAALLLGSLQAACHLEVINEELGVSVTVVVSMCDTVTLT